MLGHLLSCWKNQVKPVVGGWIVFHDPSKVLPKFTPNFTIFPRKTKADTIRIPGTEFEPHPKDLDVKNQFFCLHIFVFHPNHNFSTILEPENQLKQENNFWNGGKRKTKKLSALFWFFAQFFFSIANNSKTRGEISCLKHLLSQEPPQEVSERSGEKQKSYATSVAEIRCVGVAGRDFYTSQPNFSISMVILVD